MYGRFVSPKYKNNVCVCERERERIEWQSSDNVKVVWSLLQLTFAPDSYCLTLSPFIVFTVPSSSSQTLEQPVTLVMRKTLHLCMAQRNIW